MATDATPPQVRTKRQYLADEDAVAGEKPTPASPPLNVATSTSAFRNVSACNRCRVRKNRCDQQLPACAACTKANVRCVGYDPITKREIPRSYVYFLETRLKYFEKLLLANDVSFEASDAFDADSRPLEQDENVPVPGNGSTGDAGQAVPTMEDARRTQKNNPQEEDKLDRLVSHIGMVSVHGTSDQRYLGSTSGISFARVVLSAVKRAVPSTQNLPSKSAGDRMAEAKSESTIRDSYFGLQTRPTVKEASFPEYELGRKLITLYFEHANPQIPILHRDEIFAIFELAYNVSVDERTSQQLYLLNIIFAIGSGIIWGSSDSETNIGDYASKRARLIDRQAQPEEYHAAAIVHLNAYLGSTNNNGMQHGASDLEELQAVLLLAGFALLRPVAPGLWYIVGVAMRMAIDLGLHYEDGSGLKDADLKISAPTGASSKRSAQQGRRQYIRDLRRRLWWCTYTFDRLVSTCVGRPFGITDQVITTEFPSLLDDRHITISGISKNASSNEPSYKHVAHHYFRLRLLQSEIVQVLQYQQAQIARMNGWNRHNDYMHKQLESPFLIKHGSFKAWRRDIDQRLFEWKESAPTKADTGVSFSHEFLELNYWQAETMLYRQSLSVPAAFAHETSPTDDVTSPMSPFTEDREDEDLIFLKCAEAGQKTLKIYRQLHRLRLVNYTYLATHHLFMAGISFLYAVWHSPAVRSRISLDDFDFTVLAATSVLGDLMAKCPPAEACRDAFERMSKATVEMCMSTPGFGFGTHEEQVRTTMAQQSPVPIAPRPFTEPTWPASKHKARRPPPKFDMNLQDLFPGGLDPSPGFKHPTTRPRSNTHRSARQRRANLSRQMSHPQQDTSRIVSNDDMYMQDRGDVLTHTTPSSYRDELSPLEQMQLEGVNTDFELDPGSNSYNPDFLSNLPGMDMLGGFNAGGAHDPSQRTADTRQRRPPDVMTELNSDNSWLDTGPPYSADGDAESEWGLGSGFGVGVGMGLDFGPQHDWSDGQGGFNLFDGFFFGGEDGTTNMGGS